MPEHIIKLSGKGKDFYLLWTTVTDSPVSYGMSLDEFKAFYKERYERSGITIIDEKAFEERLKRVEEKGCSRKVGTLDGLLRYNHAGDDEETISKEEIFRRYCPERS